MSNPTQHRSEGTQSAKRILAGAPIAPQRTRAITTPRTSVQGMGTAVRIERRKGEGVQSLWAEGVPFRVLSQPRRVQPSTTAEPLLMRTGCATGGACMGHPDCADTQCQGHPDQSDEQKAFDLRGMDYSDHHGPKSPEDRALRAWVWRTYLAGVALVVVVVASVVLK